MVGKPESGGIFGLWNWIAAVWLTGCAAALGKPVGLEELAIDRGRWQGSTDSVLANIAEQAFQGRNWEDAQVAAEVWTELAVRNPLDTLSIDRAVRVLVWLAEYPGVSSSEREEAAVRAVRVAQWCDVRAPGRPACAYWLGASLGAQAREKRGTALNALGKMESLFLRALSGAPSVAEAGPDRALASLYSQAPGWPAGPGDVDKGVLHGLAAVERAPSHPPNYLAAAEALSRSGENSRAREYLLRGLEVARRLAGSGNPDAESWVTKFEELLRVRSS